MEACGKQDEMMPHGNLQGHIRSTRVLGHTQTPPLHPGMKRHHIGRRVHAKKHPGLRRRDADGDYD